MTASSKASDWLEIGCIGGVAVLWSWFWYGAIDPVLFADKDLGKYRVMAEAAPFLWRDAPAPFGFRLLGPWLAGIMPGSVEMGFSVLSHLLLGVVAMLWFRRLHMHGLTKINAMMWTALLLFQPHLFGFIAFNPYQIADALTFIWLLLGWEAIERRRTKWIIAILFLAALTRETGLLLIPFMLWQYRADAAFAFAKHLLSIAPALLVWIFIRWWMTPANATWSLLHAGNTYLQHALGWEAWFRLLLNALAPLSLLFMYWWRPFGAYFRQQSGYAIFLVFLFVSCFLGADKERLWVPAFFVLGLPAAALLTAFWSLRTRWLLLTSALFVSWHPIVARFSVLGKWAHAFLTLSLTVLIVIWVWRKETQPSVSEIETTLKRYFALDNHATSSLS